jgi:hypothetical protein
MSKQLGRLVALDFGSSNWLLLGFFPKDQQK